MGLLAKLGMKESDGIAIDWELTPSDTFGTFESWGGRERVRNPDERFYYFYIDNWEPPARLCLMERGIKFARVLAHINAPQGMLDKCVAAQGKSMLDQSYAIDDDLRQWIQKNVIDSSDDSCVIPVLAGHDEEPLACNLPGKDEAAPAGLKRHALRHAPAFIQEEEVAGIAKAHNFFDNQHNPAGRFANYLVNNNDGKTITDLVTGVMWQRTGCDITAIRHIHAWVKKLNEQKYAGYSDWRLPTMEEALALLEPERNDKGLHLHPCFCMGQPFIFLADERKPGGYWFMDFKQGSVFWASGTIPGGFGRVCRTV
ncbi:MAG: DUF1566 domain-containing protein [Desulfobulbaceae bacterium]|nr:DUF1566 domain-containing protein [Desulfobulbaceae bacterium]